MASMSSVRGGSSSREAAADVAVLVDAESSSDDTAAAVPRTDVVPRPVRDTAKRLSTDLKTAAIWYYRGADERWMRCSVKTTPTRRNHVVLVSESSRHEFTVTQLDLERRGLSEIAYENAREATPGSLVLFGAEKKSALLLGATPLRVVMPVLRHAENIYVTATALADVASSERAQQLVVLYTEEKGRCFYEATAVGVRAHYATEVCRMAASEIVATDFLSDALKNIPWRPALGGTGHVTVGESANALRDLSLQTVRAQNPTKLSDKALSHYIKRVAHEFAYTDELMMYATAQATRVNIVVWTEKDTYIHTQTYGGFEPESEYPIVNLALINEHFYVLVPAAYEAGCSQRRAAAM